jgi:type IV pilus assembly protein PilF
VKNSKLIAVLTLLSFLLTGCITSTTTGSLEPDSDEDDAAEYNYTLGARYYKNESYELARDRLERAIEMEPRMAKAHMMLGMTYEALENPRLATKAYRDAIRVAPRDFNIQNAYAVYLCRQGDYSGALRHFDKASKHPENDDAEQTLTNAGLCFLQKPDYAVAEGYFREALEHRTNYGEALLQLTLLKFRQEDYMGARAFVERYMSANMTTAGVLYLAAEIESKLGNDRGRSEYVNRLLREFPESPEARKALASESS